MWDEKREEKVLEFVQQEPLIVEIREEFAKYDNKAKEIKHLPDHHIIGAVQVEMGIYFSLLLCKLNNFYMLHWFLYKDYYGWILMFSKFMLYQ